MNGIDITTFSPSQTVIVVNDHSCINAVQDMLITNGFPFERSEHIFMVTATKAQILVAVALTYTNAIQFAIAQH